MVTDVRRANKHHHTPPYTDGAASERLSNVKFHLADDLTLTSDTTASEEHSSGSILSGGLPTAHTTTVYIRHDTKHPDKPS